MTNPTKQSRFSTLKVFKFAGSKQQPPPPPPKDPFYLANRSLVSLSQSLSPDSGSVPPTPNSPSPNYARSPSPTPSRSTTAPSIAAPSPPPEQMTFKKGFLKISSLGKRSLYSAKSNASMKSLQSQVTLDEQPPDIPDDESISMPWNFQHHVHVDETMNGLPPSWSSSLAEAGFSEDEIAALHSKRTRSPTSQYLYTDRPQTPADQPRTIITNPTPRTTSLPRDYSDASLSQRSRSGSMRRPQPVRKSSSSSRQFSDTSSEVSSTEAQQLYMNGVAANNVASTSGIPVERTVPARAQMPSVPSMYSASSVRTTEKGRPKTPPQRTFRVVNEDPSGSPPPAYDSPAQKAPMPAEIDDDDLAMALPPPRISPPRLSPRPSPTPPPPPPQVPIVEEDEDVEDELEDEVSIAPLSPLNRLSIKPPRLSLHGDSLGDLSMWSESLFSGLSLENTTPPSSASRAEPSASSPSAMSLNNTPRQRQQQKPVPSILLKPLPHEEGPSSTATAPLFDEIMGIMGTSSSRSPRTGSFPTFPDSGSPVLPRSPSEGEYQDLRSSFLQVHQEGEEDDGFATGRGRQKRDSSMSNNSNRSTVTVTGATIIRGASFATRAVAEVIQHERGGVQEQGGSARVRDSNATVRLDFGDRQFLRGDGEEDGGLLSPPRSPMSADSTPRHSVADTTVVQSSPRSNRSSFASASSGSSSSVSLSTLETEVSPRQTLNPTSHRLSVTSEVSPKSPHLPYLDKSPRASPQPSPSQSYFNDVPKAEAAPTRALVSRWSDASVDMVRRPSIVVNGFGTLPEEEDDDERPPSAISSSSSSPLTPAQRYPGWMYEVVRPLEEFIDDVPDPRELYVDLQEIAEGDSGSVFSARQVNTPLGSPTFVAIKQVAILPSGSQKLRDLERELVLLKRVRHQNVLGMDALHVDLVEDTLWIQMELMERSLADVIALFEEGITLQEKVMARFASDAISALDYLHSLKIAHRDVRSDNMLLNIDGVLKLCDFSNAVQVTPQAPTCTDVVGVIYWQAPEMRAGPYDALKVDTWSLGATVWEMVQGEPPFSEVEDPRQIGDQWPSLRQPELYSRSFHDFLHLSSLPSVSRPDPGALSKTPFIRSACPRSVVVQVLSDCRTIEERMHKRLSVDSQGTISS